MAKRTAQELKEELQKLPHMTLWNDVHAGEIYHIPPILGLERRKVLILTKSGNDATYKRVDDGDKSERKMHKSSVFARFLVKEKKF